jgi:hypothetical protein
MSLPINWFLTHKPAPGSDVPYFPKPVDFDPSREGDFATEPGETALRSIARATRGEQARIERAYR